MTCASVQGADFIECDVVLSADCNLICRHEPLLSNTTNADNVLPEHMNAHKINGKVEKVHTATFLVPEQQG